MIISVRWHLDFPDEYAVAKEVRSYIETYFQVDIPEVKTTT